MKKLILVMAVTSLMAGTASAQFFTDGPHCETFSFPLSPGMTTLNLPQFDPTGGRTLVAVEMELTGTITAGVTAENDSAIPGEMGIQLVGFVTANGPNSLSASALIDILENPVPVAASDGVPDSGPDFHDFGTVTGTDTDNDSQFGGNLAPFIGLGTIPVNVNGSGGFSATGVTDSTVQVTNFGASGEVCITYTYIPEPATFGLLAMGGLMLIRRKRK